LVGLERGWKTRGMTPGRRAAGVRTFALCGLLGGMVAALAQANGTLVSEGLVLGFGFAVYAAVIAVFERDADRAAGSYSATTTVAALLTFVLGAYAVLGDLRVAAAAAVATTGILAAREDIHTWVARITWPELRSALVLLAMTFIVLPVIPDMQIGPSGGFNPREVWLIAIVLAGVAFIGYGAVRLFGAERGVLLGAIAGGLVSSTATASAISFLRVIGIVAVLKPVLLVWIVSALAAATLVAVAYAVATVHWLTSGEGDRKLAPAEFKNPFSLLPVVGFAVFLGIVIVAGHALGEAFGKSGALLGAAGLGLADVDAVTVAMARLAPEPLSRLGASEAILAAVASNMLSKLVIAMAIGRGRFAAEMTAMTVGCWLAGLLGLWASFGLGAA
jgi:uncharacterized membrane protein (DUF4010 family)